MFGAVWFVYQGSRSVPRVVADQQWQIGPFQTSATEEGVSKSACKKCICPYLSARALDFIVDLVVLLRAVQGGFDFTGFTKDGFDKDGRDRQGYNRRARC